MLIQPQADVGEGSGQPTDSQHPSTTASPSTVVPIPVLSSSQPQKTQKHRKTKRKSTEISQSSGPSTLVADETVNEERGDTVERAATTATSLDVEQGSGGSPRCQEAIRDTIAQTRSKRVSTPSYDSPILGVNTPGSDEERIKHKELMDMCTKLSDKVLDLENVKDGVQARVESSEESLGKKDASKQGRNSDNTEELNVAEDEHMFDISYLADTEVVLEEEPIKLVKDKGSAKKVVSAAKDKDSTTETVTTASVNPDDVTLAETLMAIRSSASRLQKLKGVLFKEPSEPTTITTSRPQPQIPEKDKGKGIMQEPEKPVKESIEAIINADRKLTEQLQAQEREELTVEEQSKLLAEFIETRRKYFAAKRVEENKNKPPIKTQQRSLMCTYLKNMDGYKHKDFKGKSFDAIKKMFDKAYKRVNIFVAMDSEVVESIGKKDESSKKKAESSGKEAVSKKRAGEKLSEESVKRQKVEDDTEKAELKLCLEIAPNDDKASKSSIVDWET
ncbi:hypothetical protein Tco_0529501 [Tanacetum coccineum]